mgnify:CR=1 FL=1
MEGHHSPVQQFRFTQGPYSQWVYYWHYAIPFEDSPELSGLQREFQKIRNGRASITLQAYAPEVFRGEAIELVKLADAAIQDFVGPDAKRSCARRPVMYVEE